MDMLVNADGVFSAHYDVTGNRVTLLLPATLLCRSHSARPLLGKKSERYYGSGKQCWLFKDFISLTNFIDIVVFTTFVF